MNRLTALLLMILLLISCAHAETASVPQTDMTGVWADAWSQRAVLEIERDGSEYVARVHWSNSAFEYVQWEMTGSFEDGMLETENCIKTLHSYAGDGSEQIEVLYENEKAALTYRDGAITWTDPEGMGAECRFERLESEAESSSLSLSSLGYLFVFAVQQMIQALNSIRA